jgi:hypothetical protein
MLQRIQKFHFIYIIMPTSFLAFSMVDYILYIYVLLMVFFIENDANVVEHGAEIL